MPQPDVNSVAVYSFLRWPCQCFTGLLSSTKMASDLLSVYILNGYVENIFEHTLDYINSLQP